MSEPYNPSPAILHTYCDPYGGNSGGAKLYLGDTTRANEVSRQWYCKNPAEVRCRMTCAHGHVGQTMNLCMGHFTQFKLRDMTYCPRCNREPPGHKCLLSLTEVS